MLNSTNDRLFMVLFLFPTLNGVVLVAAAAAACIDERLHVALHSKNYCQPFSTCSSPVQREHQIDLNISTLWHWFGSGFSFPFFFLQFNILSEFRDAFERFLVEYWLFLKSKWIQLSCWHRRTAHVQYYVTWCRLRKISPDTFLSPSSPVSHSRM